MKKPRVDWRGSQLLAVIQDATPGAMWEAGEVLLKAAESKAPRGATGDLADSGYVTTAKKSSYQAKKTRRKEVKVKKDNELIVGFSAFYALFQEIGTKKMGARPFLRPALDENMNTLGAKIAGSIKRKVDYQKGGK